MYQKGNCGPLYAAHGKGVGLMESYGQFQQYCANMGFVDTPLSLSQWLSAWWQLGDAESVYGVACDVACGVFFLDAVSAQVRAHMDNMEKETG